PSARLNAGICRSLATPPVPITAARSGAVVIEAKCRRHPQVILSESMDSRKLVRVQEKGQITLPAEARRRLGLNKGDLVAVEQTADGVLIKPLSVVKRRSGSHWLKQLYDEFAPVRREAADSSEADVNQA